MIENKIHICVGIYGNDADVPGCEIVTVIRGNEAFGEGDSDYLTKVEVIFNCVSVFCMSVYNSLCGVMTACISYLNFGPVLSGLKSCCSR